MITTKNIEKLSICTIQEITFYIEQMLDKKTNYEIVLKIRKIITAYNSLLNEEIKFNS